MESHRHKLPPEIQEMIVRLSENQIAYEQIIERDIHMCEKGFAERPQNTQRRVEARTRIHYQLSFHLRWLL